MTKEAVEQPVHEDDTLVVWNYAEGSSQTLIFDVLRQKEKHDTVQHDHVGHPLWLSG